MGTTQGGSMHGNLDGIMRFSGGESFLRAGGNHGG